jgi:hypothetical protein
MEVIYIVIILVLIWIVFKSKYSEGLVQKPSDLEIKKFTNDVINNKNVFYGGSFYTAREKMPWIDPIAYEELRMLAKQNNLNNMSIAKVFN